MVAKHNRHTYQYREIRLRLKARKAERYPWDAGAHRAPAHAYSPFSSSDTRAVRRRVLNHMIENYRYHYAFDSDFYTGRHAR